MNLRNIMTLGLCIAVATAAALPVFAEDTKPAAAAETAPAKPVEAAKPAEPATKAEAAKPAGDKKKKPAAGAGQAKTEVKVTVTGKLEKKQILNKKSGKMQDILVLTVATATGPDGKSMEGRKGKPLRVIGNKELNVKSYAGKDVTIEGTIVNQRRLVAKTVK